MKSLYESILSSTKSGKLALIKKWCEENQPFAGNWEITKDNEIACTKRGGILILKFDTFSELPDYIKFKDDNFLMITVGIASHVKLNVKSLRGLPKVCGTLMIKGGIVELPSFEISTNWFSLHTPDLKKTGDITINMVGGNEQNDRVVRIKDLPYEEGKGFADLLPNLRINGARQFDVVNCAYLGDTFSSLMSRKAEMNKYVGHFEFPIREEALPLIEKYFGKNFDMSRLEEILYTQNSQLTKKNGKWYRFKNRR